MSTDSAIVVSLIYNANGGIYAPKSQEIPSGGTITIHNYSPTRSGHTFLGWSEDSETTTATYQPGDVISDTGSNVTLYAIWQKNSDTQNIYLCKDGTCYAAEFIEIENGMYFGKDGKVYSSAFVVGEVDGGQFAIGSEFIALNFVEGIPSEIVYSEYILVDENGNTLVDENGNVLICTE